MGSIREVVEGIQTQGENETLAWALTTTPYASTPTDVAITVKDETAGGGAVALCSGTATVGDVITATIGGLTKDHIYRVEYKFTVGANVYEPYVRVRCEE